MQEAFFQFISDFGYFAVAALILLENVFPPIPSEVILPLSGFLATQTDMSLGGVIAFATVGSVVGAYFLYGIGRLPRPSAGSTAKARSPSSSAAASRWSAA